MAAPSHGCYESPSEANDQTEHSEEVHSCPQCPAGYQVLTVNAPCLVADGPICQVSVKSLKGPWGL